MSFQPAKFTDVQRSGPPTTRDGKEWSVPISSQPPDEWLGFLGRAASQEVAVAVSWAATLRVVQLGFTSAPDAVPRTVQAIDGWIARANEQYRGWLDEAHRRGSERRRDQQTEADRVRDLNERFKNL